MNRRALMRLLPEFSRAARRAAEAVRAARDGQPDRFREGLDTIRRIRGGLAFLDDPCLRRLGEEVWVASSGLQPEALGGPVDAAVADVLQRLPGVFEALAHGQRGCPASLVAAVNVLRLARNAPCADELSLLRHSVDPGVPADCSACAEAARRLRPVYQRGLLSLLLGSDEDGLTAMRQAVDELATIGGDSAAGALWWLAGALLEAEADGGLIIDRPQKLALARLDRELRREIANGSGEEPPPPALINALLSQVAGVHPLSKRVRTAQRLAAAYPEHVAVRMAARGDSAHHDPEAVGVDLDAARRGLEGLYQSGVASAEVVNEIHFALNRVAEGLRFAGLEEARRGLQVAVQALPGGDGDTVDGESIPADMLETAALGVLHAEAALDAVERASAQRPPGPEDGLQRVMGRVEYQRGIDGLLDAACVELLELESVVEAWLQGRGNGHVPPEPGGCLEAVAGAARIGGLNDVDSGAASLREAWKALDRLVEGGGAITEAMAVELASAVVLLEQYLVECRHEGVAGADRELLRQSREAVDRLHGLIAQADAAAETLPPAGVDEATWPPGADETSWPDTAEPEAAAVTETAPAGDEEPALDEILLPGEADGESAEGYWEKARRVLGAVREDLVLWQEGEATALDRMRGSVEALKGEALEEGHHEFAACCHKLELELESEPDEELLEADHVDRVYSALFEVEMALPDDTEVTLLDELELDLELDPDLELEQGEEENEDGDEGEQAEREETEEGGQWDEVWAGLWDETEPPEGSEEPFHLAEGEAQEILGQAVDAEIDQLETAGAEDSTTQWEPMLQRVVEQTAEACGRDAELVMTGMEAEPPAEILEGLAEPLEELVGHAVARGIEPPEERHEAGKPESGRVHVDVHRAGDDWVVVVADDGAGLDGEGAEIAALAEKVRGLGGEFQVDSEPGAGNTFTIRIPVTTLSQEPEPARILVVDDSRTLSKIAGRLLASEGLQSVTAADPGSALRRVAAESPAVIVVDLELPGIDTVELTRRLQEAAPPDTPLVAVTTQEGDRERLEEAGVKVAGIVSDRYDYGQLVPVVRSAVAGRG